MNATIPIVPVGHKNSSLDTEIEDECPICASRRDPKTGMPLYNAVTLAAMQEARDIANGKIPGKWYKSIEEAREDLGV